MKPGATMKPLASTTRVARFGSSLPISAILPSLIAMSASNQGFPVPSTILPPATIMSKSTADVAMTRSIIGMANTTAKAHTNRILFDIVFSDRRFPPHCFLPPASSCFLPPASCLLPPASCLLPPAPSRLLINDEVLLREKALRFLPYQPYRGHLFPCLSHG